MKVHTREHLLQIYFPLYTLAKISCVQKGESTHSAGAIQQPCIGLQLNGQMRGEKSRTRRWRMLHILPEEVIVCIWEIHNCTGTTHKVLRS